MKVKAWNDGAQSETGEGYGITISTSNRKNYFCNDWDVITIHIDNNEVEIELEETFWTTDNIIKHIEIGKYLIGNGFATWGHGKPPILDMKILNQQEFLLEVQTTAKKMQYNLSGHGQLSFYLYPYAEKVYGILCNHNYDAKFNYTNQLGALKRVLPGAHYTRNEYIILQWYLIHELKNRMKDVGLGSSNQILKDLSIEGHSTITGGDLLQCLALLSNMGHFPDTFALLECG